MKFNRKICKRCDRLDRLCYKYVDCISDRPIHENTTEFFFVDKNREVPDYCPYRLEHIIT